MMLSVCNVIGIVLLNRFIELGSFSMVMRVANEVMRVRF